MATCRHDWTKKSPNLPATVTSEATWFLHTAPDDFLIPLQSSLECGLTPKMQTKHIASSFLCPLLIFSYFQQANKTFPDTPSSINVTDTIYEDSRAFGIDGANEFNLARAKLLPVQMPSTCQVFLTLLCSFTSLLVYIRAESSLLLCKYQCCINSCFSFIQLEQEWLLKVKILKTNDKSMYTANQCRKPTAKL